MNESNKEFSENPNRREEEEERREKEEGRRRQIIIERKRSGHTERKKEMVTLFTRLLLQCSQTHSWPRTCVTCFLFSSFFVQ
jgi:hypothetical protein